MFDGKAFAQKADELQRRKELKLQNEEKASEAKQAGDIDTYKKYLKRSVKVDPSQYQQAKTLLEACGVPCIIARGEAEALAVALCRAGLCDGVASNDLDCVCYGAPLFIRNLGNDEKREVIQIKYEDVLKQLNFSQE